MESLVGSCVRKLHNIVMEEAILILGIKEELRTLGRTMAQLQCFLNSAEQRRFEESKVNDWLGELKDAMYEAEDIMDLASFEGSKLLAQNPSLPSSSSINFTRCAGFNNVLSCIPNIRRRHEIAIRIKNFNSELEKILKMGKRYLKLQNMQPTVIVSAVKPMKTCHLMEPNLVGKETSHACTRLVQQVLAHKDKKLYKLAIVTGGIGKTTVAQIVYNNHKVEIFSKRAWICVTQDYSEVDLLKEILRNFVVYQEQGGTVTELKSKLAETVKGSSLFLVLDDVWKPEVWTHLLRTPLLSVATAIIVITTRQETIACAIGVEYMHRVEPMSSSVGWELLWKSMNIEEKEVEYLKNIGIEIVHKCGRLPLAIKVIASALCSKDKSKNEWTKFINRSAWSMRKLPIDLSGALYLSYEFEELPHHLKRCFLYCALHPEDWFILCDDLIGYWIAEGFVEEQEGQLLEDTAEEYYYELIYRNLLQPERTYFNNIMCTIHDLLKQLALHLSGDEIFYGEPQALEAKTLSKLRRASIYTKNDSTVFSHVDKEHTRARTLNIQCNKSSVVENTILNRFPCLRVLNLTGSPIEKIPHCIGDLIHLRLLDLDNTNIYCLPESIGSLKNLQILNLDRCVALHRLPMAITQLCNLRRLGLSHTPINEVTKWISGLKFLNDLGGFSIGGGSGNTKRQDGWNMDELGPLSQLRRLDMIKLERATLFSGTDLLLTSKRHLKVLYLCCNGLTNEVHSDGEVINNEMIFEQLTPPRNLEDLSIYHFVFAKTPRTLRCKSCMHLPPIGRLPYLKYLKILGTNIAKIGS
uniref:NB-ARC domain-containing protein n=1 Tax=Oryza brachyantha TaxID=4533 RepID=J3MRN0_ORYBR